MMNEQQIKERLTAIRPPEWEKAVFLDWYCVNLWAENSDLFLHIETWALHHLGLKSARSNETAHRIAFEGYLQAQKLMPLAVAADQLAVCRDEFGEILDRMVGLHLIQPSSEWSEGLCASDLPDKISALLPSFPRRVFANVPSKIRTFHEAIRKDLELDIPMVTSKPFEGNEQLPAYQRDILTREPVTLGDSVWLDFKKPISLRPDICSKRTYLGFRELLAPFRMGSEPQFTGQDLHSYVAESGPVYG